MNACQKLSMPGPVATCHANFTQFQNSLIQGRSKRGGQGYYGGP